MHEPNTRLGYSWWGLMDSQDSSWLIVLPEEMIAIMSLPQFKMCCNYCWKSQMSPPDNPTSKDLAEKLQLHRSDTHGNFQSFSEATRKK